MARIIATVFALGVALGLGPSYAAQARALVLGSVSANPSDEIKDWLPFARYLAGELAEDGISEGKIIIARDTREMIAFLREGKVDLYIDSPLVMIDVANASGSKLMARRWKNGVAEYTSVVFARKDAGITSLKDLTNKVIAFEKVSSSTGYLLPWLEMQQAGLTIQPMDNHTIAPPSGEVGYRFSGADRNTMAWVVHGRVAAGATSRGDFDKMNDDQRAQLTVIAETAAIPRHVVAHRADLPPALVARIKGILFAMDQSEQGQKALGTFERTTKFDDIPPRSLEALASYETALRAAGLTQ